MAMKIIKKKGKLNTHGKTLRIWHLISNQLQKRAKQTSLVQKEITRSLQTFQSERYTYWLTWTGNNGGLLDFWRLGRLHPLSVDLLDKIHRGFIRMRILVLLPTCLVGLLDLVGQFLGESKGKALGTCCWGGPLTGLVSHGHQGACLGVKS